MRRTAESPQFFAISVAFDDHGESVPGRGTTTKSSPPSDTRLIVRAVGQQPIERLALGGRERALELDEMPVLGRNGGDGMVGSGSRECGMKLGDAKRRQRVAPA